MELRQRHNMTQDQLAEKLAVTRQAVSRWENGESVPNPETLKQLSALFDTSINHLLGDPHKLICQCCGTFRFQTDRGRRNWSYPLSCSFLPYH